MPLNLHYNLHYKTQLHGQKNLAKGATNDIGHAFMMGSPIKI